MTTSKAYIPFSLLYALLIAYSYHYWGLSYVSTKDLPSHGMFLLLMFSLYAVPTYLYFTFLACDKIKWMSQIPYLGKACIVILIVLVLYLCYTRLANWDQWYPGRWDKQYSGDYSTNSDLTTMRIMLFVTHIPVIAAALLLFLSNFKEHMTAIKNKAVKFLIIIGLLLYLMTLAYFLFYHAAVLAIPFLLIIFLAYNDYYKWKDRNISRKILYICLVDLFIMLLCRGLFDDPHEEFVPLVPDLLFFSNYLVIIGVAVGLIYGIIKAITDRLSLKPFIKGTICGLSVVTALSPIILIVIFIIDLFR